MLAAILMTIWFALEIGATYALAGKKKVVNINGPYIFLITIINGLMIFGTWFLYAY